MLVTAGNAGTGAEGGGGEATGSPGSTGWATALALSAAITSNPEKVRRTNDLCTDGPAITSHDPSICFRDAIDTVALVDQILVVSPRLERSLFGSITWTQTNALLLSGPALHASMGGDPVERGERPRTARPHRNRRARGTPTAYAGRA